LTGEGIPEGWVQRSGKAFRTHVGPFYCPPGDDKQGFGFLADERHGNKRGVVHGGMLATASAIEQKLNGATALLARRAGGA